MIFDKKSVGQGVHVKYLNKQYNFMSDQTLVTPSIKGGRNAGIYLSNNFIPKIDSVRGDVRRSTFVMRAIERRLEEMGENSSN